MRRVFLFLLLCIWLGGCASTGEHRPGEFQAPVHRGLSEEPSASTKPFLVDDPWEGFNRHMYRFNAEFDRYVFLPLVEIYEGILPTSVQNGVSNIFNNLKEIPIFINSVLQGKAKKASVSLGRFIFNTTVGFGGLVDVLGNGGIHQENEDFGQTLGFWGMPSGPYLVLPFLGPSSVRDSGGLLADTIMAMMLDPTDLAFHDLHWTAQGAGATGFYALKAVDTRHQVKFRYYQTGSPFEYQLVRFIFMKKRGLDILK